MIDTSWRNVWKNCVVPSLDAHFSSEAALSAVVSDTRSSEEDKDRAMWAAVRCARAAVIEIHHFPETAIADKAPWAMAHVPVDEKKQEAQLRRAIAGESAPLIRDSSLKAIDVIREVANSIKHGVLNPQGKARPLRDWRDVLVDSRSYGSGPSGLGKYGGSPEVCVRLSDTTLPLGFVLGRLKTDMERAMAG